LIKDACIDLNVVAHTCVDRLGLMTSDARQSAPSSGLPFCCDLWVAAHTYPTHIQALEGVIPPFLIGDPFKCQVVKQHIYTTAGKRSHGDLESRIERHEKLSASDHALVHPDAVDIVDQLWWQCPNQEIDSEEQPSIG